MLVPVLLGKISNLTDILKTKGRFHLYSDDFNFQLFERALDVESGTVGICLSLKLKYIFFNRKGME